MAVPFPRMCPFKLTWPLFRTWFRPWFWADGVPGSCGIALSVDPINMDGSGGGGSLGGSGGGGSDVGLGGGGGGDDGLGGGGGDGGGGGGGGGVGIVSGSQTAVGSRSGLTGSGGGSAVLISTARSCAALCR